MSRTAPRELPHPDASPPTNQDRLNPLFGEKSGEPSDAKRHLAILGLMANFGRGNALPTIFDEAAELIVRALPAETCAILELPRASPGHVAPGDPCAVKTRVTGMSSDQRPRQNRVAPRMTASPSRQVKRLLRELPPAVLPGDFDEEDSHAVVVEIPGNEGVLGRIEVSSRSKKQLSRSDRQFLNNVASALGVLIDHSRLGEKLRRSEELHRLVFKGSEKVLFYEHDLEHVLSYASQSSAEMLGYSPEELIGRRCEDFHAAESSKERANALTDEALRNGVPVPSYLAVLRHKEGHEVIVEAIEAPMVRSGEIVGIQGLARDVTERQLNEKHLRHRTAYLNALLVHNPLGIIVLDTQNRIEMCNPAFEKIFLYKQDEIKGRDIDDLLGPGDLHAEALELTRRTKSGAAVHANAFRARKDGTLVSVEIYSLPLVVEGETVGTFGIYQDTTERHLAEESVKFLSGRLLQIQDEERRRIARDLHDTTVQDLAALAMRLGALGKSCHGVLSSSDHLALLENADLAENCARELRTLAYLLHPPLLDEAGIGSAAKWYAEGFSRRTGIHVKFEISPRMKRLPREMEMTLFRVIQESLSNVFKHSRGRKATIRLYKKERSVYLEITDDGVGIPQGILKSLEATDSTIGMGIAGMRERVKQFRGTLDIRSVDGTTIRVIVPVESHGS